MAPPETTADIAPEPVRLGYCLTQWFVRSTFKLLFGLKIHGRSNVPVRGAFILASNHQSLFDPPIVGSTCPREINYAAKKELFRLPILGALIRYYNSIPVNRSGYDRALLTRLDELLTYGNPIIIFPEGHRYLDGNLHQPKLGIGMIASEHPDVPVVPVYVRDSARIRRQLLRRKLSVTFGRPVYPAQGMSPGNVGKEAYRYIADRVMAAIAQVGGVAGAGS
jgi:1-acyl-sn-glycerol-3-phosphate acyltransferase